MSRPVSQQSAAAVSQSGLRVALCIYAWLVLAGCCAGSIAGRKNVLLLICDDLRTQLRSYGHADYMHTPNIDKLAADALVFDRAYTNYPYCAPSRNSFMSGRLPSKTKAWNFIDHFREPSTGLDWVALPQYFRDAGYWTVGSGKLYHPGLPPNEDNAYSWSEPLVDVGGNEGCNCSTTPGGDKGKMSCQLPDDVGDGCADLINWDAAQRHLQRAKTLEQPFFIGFGIHKPHLPWAVPERFFRQYTNDALPLAEHKNIPTGMPPIAWHRGQWGHFNHSFDPIGGPVSDTIAREARHGYFAAVSFADDLVGKALNALEETGKANNTIVLLTADHGWQLGEHNEWCKQTLFDVTLHIPLIIRAPGAKFGRSGQHTRGFAELVDLYRTLVDLAGLPPPAADVDGTSLAPLLDNPEPSVGEAFKQAAYSQMARCLLCLEKPNGKLGAMCPAGGSAGHSYSPYVAKDDCADTPKQKIGYMGFTIRTSAWRFTQWVQWDGDLLQPDWTKVNASELYSYECNTVSCDNDFDAHDNVNVVGDPSHSSTVASLQARLRRHYANSSFY